MTDIGVYDHIRVSGTDQPDGIYRVVGVRDGGVTALKVADTDGRRIHTGEVVRLDQVTLDDVTSVPNPDGNRPLVKTAASKLRMMYWSGRAFVHQLAAQPVPAAAAGGLVLVGLVGEQTGQLPEWGQGVLILVGGLSLAYVGSGRLS
jgi:hypothetical protein